MSVLLEMTVAAGVTPAATVMFTVAPLFWLNSAVSPFTKSEAPGESHCCGAPTIVSHAWAPLKLPEFHT